MSTKKQWEELADEAIKDAAYWKKRARKAERLLHNHTMLWGQVARDKENIDWETITDIDHETREFLQNV